MTPPWLLMSPSLACGLAMLFSRNEKARPPRNASSETGLDVLMRRARSADSGVQRLWSITD